jgi:alpha-beta hydrolase superfamily lysophospholipase
LIAACGSQPNLPVRAAAFPVDAAHSERTFTGREMLPLWAQAWRPATEPRAVFVVVHGLKDHSSRYGELAARLVEKGISVHAADLRGHGRSAGSRVYITHFDDYLDDLGRFLDDVHRIEGDKPVFLFGHSMGGAIATLYTITRKPALAGLVLSAPALHADVSGVKKAGTRLVAGISPRAGVFQLDLEKFSRDPAVVKACEDDPLVFQPGAPARTAKELLDAIDEIESREEEVDAPLLVLHGSADEVTDPNGSKALALRAHSKDKRLVVYPGLVHDLLHEPERAKVLEDVVSWVDAHAPK